MSNPKVSVVVVNYNGINYLDACFSSLENQIYPNLEIILVDNASTDESVEYVEEHFPPVKIIENPENYGFAKANNIGIDVAKGDFIATLNNDTRADCQWISELVEAAESEKKVGMCASKMLFMKHPECIDSVGINISRSGAVWDCGQFAPASQYVEKIEVFGPCAGAALYRKKMLDETGLFDEDFFIYMEDADLAFRGRLAGWKCLYVPSAMVLHHHGGFGGVDTDFTIYYGNRNIVWNTFKNFPTSLLITSLPWIVGRNIAVVPYYAVKGHGKAILKAKIDAVKGLPKMLRKRKEQREMIKEPEIGFIKTWNSISKKKI